MNIIKLIVYKIYMRKHKNINCIECNQLIPFDSFCCPFCGQIPRKLDLPTDEIAYTGDEDSFQCHCPGCKTEVSGEHITIRYWKEGGCSHNGVDVYVCPNCKHKFERRAMGIPYNYMGVHEEEQEQC